MRPEYYYMGVIAPSFILVPLLIALFRYRRLPADGKLMFYYLLLETVVSTIATWLVFERSTNLPLFHFSTIIETLLLLYYFILISRHTIYSPWLYGMLIVFPLLALLNILFLQPLSAFNSYALSLKALLIIACCFLYWWYHELPAGKSWSSSPQNWILSGLLLYFSSSFILFTFSNVIIAATSKNISLLLWNIHATLTIFMYLLIAVGLTRYKKS